MSNLPPEEMTAHSGRAVLDPAEYAQIDHRLRFLLFGDGATTSGYVKGEAARLDVSAELNRMQSWRKQLQARVGRLIVELEAERVHRQEHQREHEQAEAHVADLLEQLETERKAWRKALDSALQYVPLKDHDFIEAIVSNPASRPT